MTQTTLDVDLHDPHARALRADRARGDFGSTLEAVRATRGAWDRRWFLLSRLDGSEPREALDALVARHPGDPAALLLRGVHAIQWGWLARGTGWARDVTEEGWRLLRERLTLAEADLRQAAAIDPYDPTPWSNLLRVGLGLSWKLDAIRAVFEEARARDPEHWHAHQQMLWAASAKWMGSHEQMLELARSVAATAPPGSDLTGLLAVVHVERFAALWREGKEAQARAYPASVHGEVLWARSKGPLSPQHRPRAWTHLVRQWFLEWFYAAGDRAAAREELEALGVGMDPKVFRSDAAEGTEHARKIRDWAYGNVHPKKKPASPLPILIGGGGVLAFAAIMTVWSMISGYVGPRRDDLLWIHNSSDAPMLVSLDGGSPALVAPGQAQRYEIEPGEHRVQALSEDHAAVHDGTFTMPERAMLGFFGHRGLYDAGGRGRYVAAHVPYDGQEAEVSDIGAGSRFFVFPGGAYEFRTRFPESMRRGTELDGVCARDEGGGIPCLR